MSPGRIAELRCRVLLLRRMIDSGGQGAPLADLRADLADTQRLLAPVDSIPNRLDRFAAGPVTASSARS